MKALRFHEFGGPEVLKFEDIPEPSAGAGQVKIKVAGCGVNPVDWKIREGYMKDLFQIPLPAIVGSEFSGTVSELGEGVTDFEVGDHVFGMGHDSCAEYVVQDSKTVAKAPPSMDLADAAAVPVCGLTAYQAMQKANLKPGSKILIHAASGGVGTFAVQIAKWLGAYVIGTTSARNAHLVQELGADEIIDYTQASFSDQLSDLDAVLESIGGETFAKSLSVLKPGGTIVSLVGPPPKGVDTSEANVVMMSAQPRREDLEKVRDLIEDLKIRPVIDTVAPFDKAIELQIENQKGHSVGKLVVRIS